MRFKHYLLVRILVLLIIVCFSALISSIIYYLSASSTQKNQKEIILASTSKVLDKGIEVIPQIQTVLPAKELKELMNLSAEIRDLYFIKESGLGVVSSKAAEKLSFYQNNLKFVPIENFSGNLLDKSLPILFMPNPDSEAAPTVASYESGELRIYTDKKFKIEPKEWSSAIWNAYLRYYLKKGDMIINGEVAYFMPSETEQIQELNINNFSYYLNKKEAESQIASNF